MLRETVKTKENLPADFAAFIGQTGIGNHEMGRTPALARRIAKHSRIRPRLFPTQVVQARGALVHFDL